MTKQELEQWLIRHNFKLDKFGHYQKQNSNGDTIRIKLSSVSARYEKKARICDHNEWIRMQSGYFKDLSLSPEDKLRGMRY